MCEMTFSSSLAFGPAKEVLREVDGEDAGVRLAGEDVVGG